MAGKQCQICNKPSGMYPLCKEHLEMKKNGLVIKNEITDKWELLSEDNNPNIKDKNCTICGKAIDEKYKYCRECYYNIQTRIEELDKNQKPTKLKDYYYNSKDYAMRIFDENKIYYQTITMSAISDILENFYNDDSINARISKDIADINKNLKNRNDKLNQTIKEKSKIEEIKIDKDKEKAKIKKTQDGHFVESEFEITVDDMLYTNNLVHAYNIKVDEIFERSVYCDWYIPVGLDKGIYIELWGVKGDAKYNSNKEEKIALYQKHKLPLIQIEYDELNGDRQRLRSSLIGRIKQLKNEINEQAQY